MAFEGDKVMNEFVLVRLLESAYTRQWHLYGQTTYRMGASKARVVFQRHADLRAEGESDTVVIGRGLITGCKSTGNRNNVNAVTIIEISSDCAFGPGILELTAVPNDDVGGREIDVNKWLSRRLFPKRSQEISDGVRLALMNLWKSIKGAFASILISCFGEKTRKDLAANSHSRENSVVATAASNNNGRSENETTIVNNNYHPADISMEARKRSLEKQAYTIDDTTELEHDYEDIHDEEDDEGDSKKKWGKNKHNSRKKKPLSRSQSLNGDHHQQQQRQVRFRRKDSLRKLKSNVTKLWHSLSHSRRSRRDGEEDFEEIPTYRSFDHLDDCFHFDEDCNYCNEVQVHEHNNDSSSSNNEMVEKRQSLRNKRISAAAAISAAAIDEDDGCVLDDFFANNEEEEDEDGFEDIKKNSCKDERISSPFEEAETPEDRLSTSEEAAAAASGSKWFEKREISTEYHPDEIVPVAFDESDDTVIVLDSMDIYKVPRASLPESVSVDDKVSRSENSFGDAESQNKGHCVPDIKLYENADVFDDGDEIEIDDGKETSEEFDKCDEDVDETFESLSKYVDQSKSLQNLQHHSPVTKNIAKFET